MLKVALFATTLLAAASMATAESPVSETTVAPAAAASCQPGQSLEFSCAMRAVDADGNGATSAPELANLAVPIAPAPDWTPLHSAPGAGLDFKDAATEPGPVLPASLDRERPQPLIPALFALGALVILLRRRPT